MSDTGLRSSFGRRSFLEGAAMFGVVTMMAGSASLLPEEAHAAKLSTGAIKKSYSIKYTKRYPYTGKRVKPSVKVYCNKKLLKAGKDYTVAYRTSKGAKVAAKKLKSIGSYYMYVTPKGAHAGAFKTKRIAFTVKYPMTSLSFKRISDQRYTGKAVKPDVILKRGKKRLVEGKDFTVEYTGNVEPGFNTARAIATGKGDYYGKYAMPFSIERPTLAAAALSELSTSPRAYGAKYWKYCGATSQVPWSACFLKYCWDLAGLDSAYGGPAKVAARTAGSWYTWARDSQDAKLLDYSKTYKAKVGDVLVDGEEKAKRVGIVVSVAKSYTKFTTVEGDLSGALGTKTYAPGNGSWKSCIRLS